MRIANINKLYLWLSFCGDTLPNDLKRETAKFILDRQARNGSFGRDIFGEIFGTCCALRVLFNLQHIDRETVGASVDFLKSRLLAFDGGDDSYSIGDLYGLAVSQSVVQFVTSRDFFAEAKIPVRPFLTRKLRLLQRPDGGYAKNRLTASSSLLCTIFGTIAQQCGDNTLYGGEDRAPLRVRDYIAKRAYGNGGYLDSLEDTEPSVAATTSAAMLLKMAYDENGPVERDTFDCQKTFDFFMNRFGNPNDFSLLSESAKAPSTFDFYHAIIGMGVLLDWNWHHLPNKVKALHHVQMFRRSDGGYAIDRSTTTSDVSSTFFGVVSTSVLAGGIINARQMKKARFFTKTI